MVSFQLRGEERELILHSSKGRVSRIDISSFPLQRELDLDWREVLGKKRELDTPQEALQTPQKKVYTSKVTLCSNCHYVETHNAEIVLPPFSTAPPEPNQIKVYNNKIKALKVSKIESRESYLHSQSIAARLSRDLSNNLVTEYISHGTEGDIKKISDHQLNLIREKMMVVIQLEMLLAEKYQKKFEKITLLLQSITGSDCDLKRSIADYESWLFAWQRKNTIPSMIERLQSIHSQSYRALTLLRWYNDFKKSNYEGWKLDRRGMYPRKSFVNASSGDSLVAHEINENLSRPEVKN